MSHCICCGVLQDESNSILVAANYRYHCKNCTPKKYKPDIVISDANYSKIYYNNHNPYNGKDRFGRAVRTRLKQSLKKYGIIQCDEYNYIDYSYYIGCSIHNLANFIETRFSHGMSWSNFGLWHHDHIKPISSFDINNNSELLDCFNYKNIQPLWAFDNLSKGARY